MRYNVFNTLTCNPILHIINNNNYYFYILPKIINKNSLVPQASSLSDNSFLESGSSQKKLSAGIENH